VLEYYWPDAYHHDDVKTLTKNLLDEKIPNWQSDDLILTGGFPCQPYSLAGKRLGKEDDRHLWPEMLRIIRELSPKWVVGENVFGLVNWDGGLVFDEVQTDLEAEGYEVQAYVLPACAVNAPHRRDRVWFVAFNPNNTRGSAGLGQVSEADGEIPKRNESAESCDASSGAAAYAASKGLERDERGSSEGKRFTSKCNARRNRGANWENFPTQSPVCHGDDGLSAKLDGITFSKWRNESIKAGGNAIVPQVVYQIFKAINQF